jgi:hypothetical protein
MNTSALVVMLFTLTTVTGLMLYFFSLVIRAPKRPEPDSFENNDDQPHDPLTV